LTTVYAVQTTLAQEVAEPWK